MAGDLHDVANTGTDKESIWTREAFCIDALPTLYDLFLLCDRKLLFEAIKELPIYGRFGFLRDRVSFQSVEARLDCLLSLTLQESDAWVCFVREFCLPVYGDHYGLAVSRHFEAVYMPLFDGLHEIAFALKDIVSLYPSPNKTAFRDALKRIAEHSNLGCFCGDAIDAKAWMLSCKVWFAQRMSVYDKYAAMALYLASSMTKEVFDEDMRLPGVALSGGRDARSIASLVFGDADCAKQRKHDPYGLFTEDGFAMDFEKRLVATSRVLNASSFLTLVDDINEFKRRCK